MNFFAYESEAERYARHRPYFHPLVIEKVRDYLQLNEPFADALDVACGTGQSTVALLKIARRIVGVDASAAMMARAESRPGITYKEASAEDLPFPDESFDLITTALAFHWFDRERFLPEVGRLLRPNGWLVVYNNGFRGRMDGNESFQQWFRDEYLARYPSPPRNAQPVPEAEWHRHRLRPIHEQTYRNEISFTIRELAAYLTTQSNIVAAVEQGNEPIDDVLAWLVEAMTPLFSAPTETFEFGGTIQYVRAQRERAQHMQARTHRSDEPGS